MGRGGEKRRCFHGELVVVVERREDVFMVRATAAVGGGVDGRRWRCLQCRAEVVEVRRWK